jgi:hypothetical protein
MIFREPIMTPTISIDDIYHPSAILRMVDPTSKTLAVDPQSSSYTSSCKNRRALDSRHILGLVEKINRKPEISPSGAEHEVNIPLNQSNQSIENNTKSCLIGVKNLP